MLSAGSYSQSTIVLKADATVNVSDTVVFRLKDYVGEHIKWQSSHNLTDWTDIAGATADSLMFVADATTYFRARVIAGFCDPFYSDTLKVQVDHQVEPGTVTDIDGNVYQTVIIGNQEWMAENLRVTRYNNGDDIPTGLSNAEWSGTTSGAYAIYPNGSISGLDSDAEVVAAYGKLYNWYAVADSRGLCPIDWSVPSDADWTALVDYVVSQGFPNSTVTNGAGNALKSCRQVGSPLGGNCNTSTHPRWDSDGTHHGFDEFGFSALPGGYRWSDGSFGDVGSFGIWWSATEYSGTYAWERGVGSGYGGVGRYGYDKRNGFSVRCVKTIE